MPKPQRLGLPQTQASQPANRWLTTESFIHPTGSGASFALWAVDGEPPHGRSSNHSRTVVIGFDYFLITRGGVRRRSELEQTLDEDCDPAR